MPVRSVLRPTIAGRFVPHAPAHANTGGSEPTNQQMADVNQTPAVTTQPVSGLGANIANISTTSTDSGTLSLTSEATSEGFVLTDNKLIYQSPAYMQAKAQASSAQSQVDYIQGVLTQANAGAYGASTSGVVNSTLFGKVNGVNWNMLNYYQGQVSDANSAMQSNAPVVVGTVSGTTITPTANTVTQPLYGNVSGQNQMLGTLSYVGKEDNGQFSLAYKSFTPGNVSVTGSIPSSQSPTGKIGYSVPADVSYNPASGSVSVVPEASYGGNLLPPITVTGTDMNSLFSMQTGIPLTTKTVYNITPSGTTSATSVTGFSQGGKTVTSLDTTMNGTKVNLSFGSGGITASPIYSTPSMNLPGPMATSVMGTSTSAIPKAFAFSNTEVQGSAMIGQKTNVTTTNDYFNIGYQTAISKTEEFISNKVLFPLAGATGGTNSIGFEVGAAIVGVGVGAAEFGLSLVNPQSYLGSVQMLTSPSELLGFGSSFAKAGNENAYGFGKAVGTIGGIAAVSSLGAKGEPAETFTPAENEPMYAYLASKEGGAKGVMVTKGMSPETTPSFQYTATEGLPKYSIISMESGEGGISEGRVFQTLGTTSKGTKVMAVYEPGVDVFSSGKGTAVTGGFQTSSVYMQKPEWGEITQVGETKTSPIARTLSTGNEDLITTRTMPIHTSTEFTTEPTIIVGEEGSGEGSLLRKVDMKLTGGKEVYLGSSYQVEERELPASKIFSNEQTLDLNYASKDFMSGKIGEQELVNRYSKTFGIEAPRIMHIVDNESKVIGSWNDRSNFISLNERNVMSESLLNKRNFLAEKQDTLLHETLHAYIEGKEMRNVFESSTGKNSFVEKEYSSEAQGEETAVREITEKMPVSKKGLFYNSESGKFTRESVKGTTTKMTTIKVMPTSVLPSVSDFYGMPSTSSIEFPEYEFIKGQSPEAYTKGLYGSKTYYSPSHFGENEAIPKTEIPSTASTSGGASTSEVQITKAITATKAVPHITQMDVGELELPLAQERLPTKMSMGGLSASSLSLMETKPLSLMRQRNAFIDMQVQPKATVTKPMKAQVSIEGTSQKQPYLTKTSVKQVDIQKQGYITSISQAQEQEFSVDQMLRQSQEQAQQTSYRSETTPSPSFRETPRDFWGERNFGFPNRGRHQKRRRNDLFSLHQVKGQDYSIDLASYTLGLKGSRGKSYYKMTGLYRPYPKRGGKR